MELVLADRPAQSASSSMVPSGTLGTARSQPAAGTSERPRPAPRERRPPVLVRVGHAVRRRDAPDDPEVAATRTPTGRDEADQHEDAQAGAHVLTSDARTR